MFLSINCVAMGVVFGLPLCYVFVLLLCRVMLCRGEVCCIVSCGAKLSSVVVVLVVCGVCVIFVLPAWGGWEYVGVMRLGGGEDGAF